MNVLKLKLGHVLNRYYAKLTHGVIGKNDRQVNSLYLINFEIFYSLAMECFGIHCSACCVFQRGMWTIFVMTWIALTSA